MVDCVSRASLSFKRLSTKKRWTGLDATLEGFFLQTRVICVCLLLFKGIAQDEGASNGTSGERVGALEGRCGLVRERGQASKHVPLHAPNQAAG